MRVNIIGTFGPSTGVSQDVSILHGLVAHVWGKETEIRHVPHFHPQCPPAEVNFFIEVINPALFLFAARNIWIPNPEWTYQSWKPYLDMVDEVWVKTLDAQTYFPKYVYVGWTSVDKTYAEVKDYSKAFMPVGKNVWRNPKPVIQAYMRIQQTDPKLYESLPHLTIVHSPAHVKVPPIPDSVLSKVTLISTVLPEAEYDAFLKESGLAICTSAAEGFGHAVNEAMSSGCNLLLSSIAPFRELTNDALWTKAGKTMEHPQCFGTLEDVDVSSIVEALKVYVQTPESSKVCESIASRERYETRHKIFVETMTCELERLQKLFGVPYSLEDRLPQEENLPSVSVITITRDRRAFIPLAKFCYLMQTYPKNKIEWVVVDDGNDQIIDLISDVPNIKYVLVDEKMTIGAKRNLAVERASHDILVTMDDDDVYPNNSILTRVAHLMMEPAAGCLFTTVIPCYDIHETKSFMNVPPMTLPMSERVSEATLCFTRAFWEAGKFPDQQIGEGNAFIHGREQMCREMSPQDIIVSLTHKKTTSSRKAPAGEPNGCHYGFSDELFTLVSEIADRI